VVTPGRRRF